MGLSDRREKQRIGDDPRNLSWADNATKFGQAYLSKLGWDPSKGLGAAGDGRKTHIKVAQKLDMLGIGAANSKDPNGIAWKQSKEFEALLKRLNESIETEGLSGKTEVQLETARTAEGTVELEKTRKRKKGTDVGDSDEKKRRKKDESNSTSQASPKIVAPRPMAHRARHIASKRLASQSSAAIAEILGIPPTPKASSSTSPIPSTSVSHTPGTLTELSDDHNLEKLTTSTKSVADYFNDRLRAKAGGSSSPSPSPLSPGASRGTSSYDISRGGLGSSKLKSGWGIDEDEPRMGLGVGSGASKFGSLMSGAFLASLPAVTPPLVEPVNLKANKLLGKAIPESSDTEKERKRRRKAEKREKRKIEEIAISDLEKPVYAIDELTAEARRKEKKAKKEKWRRSSERDDGSLEEIPRTVADTNINARMLAKEVRRKERAKRKAV